MRGAIPHVILSILLLITGGCRPVPRGHVDGSRPSPPAARVTAPMSPMSGTAAPQATGGVAPAPVADAMLVRRVADAIALHRLTELAPECLSLELQPSMPAEPRRVDVREKHGAACGGDPATAPRLFSVEVDPGTGALTTDARSLTGEMEPLDPAPASR